MALLEAEPLVLMVADSDKKQIWVMCDYEIFNYFRQFRFGVALLLRKSGLPGSDNK